MAHELARHFIYNGSVLSRGCLQHRKNLRICESFCNGGSTAYAKKYQLREWVERNSGRLDEELGQTVTNGKGGGGGPVLAARLVKDAREVMSDGFLAESQLLSDLGVGQASGYQA